MSSVSLQHVEKMYDKNMATVHDLTLDIQDHEFLVLVGPSGAGKSTVLRLVAGLEEMDGGDILMDGCSIQDLEPSKRDVAMVFQNYALYPNMTVYNNMAFALKIQKVPREERDRRILETAKLLEIDQLLKRKPRALSGGERQRVALGRAMVRNPKVFLMDEPLSNLDATLRIQMRTQIARLHRKLQATFIYVTHDQTEAMTMGTRVAVMRDGMLQQVDTPQKIYEQPANQFVAGFIGSPAMNFMNVHLLQKEGRVIAQSKSVNLTLLAEMTQKLDHKYIDQLVVMGIRPEHLSEEANSQDELLARGKVEMAEPLGADVYLHVALEGNSQTVVARVRPQTAVRVDDEIELYLNPEQLRFFDIETGAAIMKY